MAALECPVRAPPAHDRPLWLRAGTEGTSGARPLIALTPEGEKVLLALQSPEIQKLAWERHGFRSGLLGVQHHPQVLQVTGIPKSIDNVIAVPNAKVMERIIARL